MSESASAALSRLTACYVAARDLTRALRRALDTDQTERLDELTAQREALLAEAAGHLHALAQARATLSPAERVPIATELESLLMEDHLLRAALAARALELPAQLAELRGAQAALGSYEAGAAGGPGSSAEVDRRG